METKGITCKIPLDLHNRISEDIRESESTMSKFIEMVINEHYMKGATGMSKMRTMAFQVSEEFFQRIKDYLTRYEQTYGKKLSQKDFVIGLIEQALEEADEEFEAAQCALPGFVDSKNEEKTERNAGYLVVSHSGGGMLRQGTRKGIRRTPANRGMRAHWVVKGLDISEDVCHGMCP